MLPPKLFLLQKSSVVQGEGLRVGVGLVLGKKDKVVWHLMMDKSVALSTICT